MICTFNNMACWDFTIFGQLYSKANSRSMVYNRRTGKVMFIKSQAALRATKDMTFQAGAARHKINSGKPIDGWVGLCATVYHKDNRGDLDIELLCDILQQAEIIGNDRYIQEKHAFKRFDKEKPRVEVKIWRI